MSWYLIGIVLVVYTALLMVFSVRHTRKQDAIFACMAKELAASSAGVAEAQANCDTTLKEGGARIDAQLAEFKRENQARIANL